MLTRLLAASALSVALLSAGAPALAAGDSHVSHDHAPDGRHCVSKREYLGTHHWQRKDQLEAKWEVTGLGRRIDDPTVGDLMIYPRCAYSTEKAWYGVRYVIRPDGHLWMKAQVWWKEPGAEAHGRPRSAH